MCFEENNISEERKGEKKAVQEPCLSEGLASTPYTGGVGVTVTLFLPVNTQLPIFPSGSLVLWGFWGASFHSASDWAPGAGDCTRCGVIQAPTQLCLAQQRRSTTKSMALRAGSWTSNTTITWNLSEMQLLRPATLLSQQPWVRDQASVF